MSQSEIQLHEAKRLLYRRKKNIEIFLMPSGRHFQVIAEMQDAVHHMRIDMLINYPSLRIKEITCEMPGVPDTICRDALNCLDQLVGRTVAPGLMRGMNDHAKSGCTHLLDLFHDACYNVLQAQGVYSKEELDAAFPGITEEQIYKIWFWFKPDFINSCVRYADDSPFIREVEIIDLPKGAEKLKALAQKQ